MVSVIMMVILTILLWSELARWRGLHSDYEFLVDQTAGENNLDINIDMTVAMECKYLRFDVLDVARSSVPVGKLLEITPATYHTNNVMDLSSHLDTQAFNKNKDRPQPGSHVDNLRVDGKLNACRVKGSFSVAKVEGMFHITAIGHGYRGLHAPHDALNFTHRIDEFSFGKRYPGLMNPLDMTHVNAVTHFDNFQYFLAIVPTIYVDKAVTFFEGLIVTNQYAVTEFSHPVDPNNPDALPGIFIKYNIEPILVRITQLRRGFIEFITRTCGIIGGKVFCKHIISRSFCDIFNSL
ncbi:endoplasmic reticulum vesicle transporter-domain-containing protein [Globomyces pollinis-pini]|nr:endoplasmic reticulum vesicle transporter-domain-containing protein [Globomyces pollinis-pini]